jgi:signal transduction histidine kinase
MPISKTRDTKVSYFAIVKSYVSYCLIFLIWNLGLANDQDPILNLESLLDHAEKIKYTDANASLDFLWKASNYENIDEAQKNRLYTLLSFTHYISGHFDSAAYYDGLLLERAIANGDRKGISKAYNGLGLIYNAQSKHEKASESHAKGLEIAVSLRDSLLIAKHLINGSISLYSRNIPIQDSAMTLLNESIKILDEIKDHELLAMSYNHRGVIKTMEGNYAGAIEDHDRALELTSQDNLWELSFGLTSKSEALFQLGAVAQSITTAERALKIAQQLDAQWEIQRISELLSRAFEGAGAYQKAFEYHKMFKTYSDSVFNKEKGEEMNAALLKLSNYENRILVQDRELAVLQANKTRITVYYLMGVIVIILLLSAVLYHFYRQKSQLSKELIVKNEIIANQHKALKELDNKKGQILSVISHDMKAPISIITGMIFMIKQEVELSDPLKEMVNRLESHIRHLTITLNDLLHWSKSQFDGEGTQKESVEISQVVIESLGLLKQHIEEKGLEIHQSTFNVCVMADYQQVNIIIRNLLSNAIKFSQENGRIEVNQTKRNDSIVISIADHGIGMDAEEVIELMSGNKPSTYGTKNESGTGFGFSLCMLYAKQNEGEIIVESQKGEGTTVSLRLPACNE